MSFDWKETLGKVAPTVAGALGGPMAGVAVAMAVEKLGLAKGSTADDLGRVIAAGSPETLVKMKELENAFKVEMKRLDVNVEDIHAKDRASARDLFKVNQGPQIALSVIFLGGYFVSMFALHDLIFNTSDVNPQIIALLGALIGVFTREMSGIMQFWFGSSSGSKEKTAKMEGMK